MVRWATLTPVSGSGDPRGMADHRVPDVMPAAVFMGLRDVRGRGPADARSPARASAPRGQPLRVCGSDLHFLVEWGGRPGAIEGHEFSRHGRRGRRRRRPAGRSATGSSAGQSPQVRRVRVLPRAAGRRSASSGAGSAPTTDDWQGAFARYKTIPRGQTLRVPDHLSLEARRARRAAGGRAARHHAGRRRAARHRAGSSPAAARSASCRSPR